MGLSGGALATAYVEIRPDTTGFEASVQTSLSGVAQRQKPTIPLAADTKAFEEQAAAAGERVRDTLTETLGAIGITLGVGETVRYFDESLHAASDLNRQLDQTHRLFGDNADAVLALGDDSVSALGLSQGAALSTENAFGRMFASFGIGGKQLADDATGISQIVARVASAAVVDPEQVSSAFETAFRTGSDRSLKVLRSFGINVTNEQLQQQAVAMGIAQTAAPTPEMQQKAKAYGDEIAVLREQLQGHATDSRKVAEAQSALGIAQGRLTEATAKYQPTSLQVAQARLAVARAEDQVTAAESGGGTGLTPAQRAVLLDKITSLEADRAKILQDSLPDLTEAQRTETLIALARQQTADLPPPQDPFAEIGATLGNISEAVGKGLMPNLTAFSSWVQAHQTELENFGKTVGSDVGTAVQDISSAVQYIVDHKTVFEGLAATIGGLFVASKVRDWTQAVDGIPGLLNSVIRRILGLPGVGTPAGGAGGIAATTEFQTAVTEFQVAVTEFAGAAGLGGRGLPTGEPVPTGGGGTTMAPGEGGTATDLLTELGLAGRTITSGGDFLQLPPPTPVTYLGQGGAQGKQASAALVDFYNKRIADLVKQKDVGGLATLEDELLSSQGSDFRAIAPTVQSAINTLLQQQFGGNVAQTAANLPLFPGTTTLATATAQPKTFGPGFSGDPGQTVRSQYAQVLNRDPEQAGYDFWTTYLRSHGQQDFESAFMGAARGNEAALVRPSPFSRPYGAVTVPPELTGPLAAIVTYLQTIATKPANSTTIINQPTSDVDALLALRRADYHNQVTVNRNVYPATSWPADLTLRPGAPS